MKKGNSYKYTQTIILICGLLVTFIFFNERVYSLPVDNKQNSDNDLITNNSNYPNFLKNKKINYSWGVRISPQGAFTSKEPFSFSYLVDGKYRTDYATLKPVLNGAVLMILRINPLISLEGGLGYAGKGSYIGIHPSTFVQDTVNAPLYSIRTFRYVNIPVFIKFHTPQHELRFYLSAGVSVGTLLTSYETIHYSDNKEEVVDWSERTQVADFALHGSTGLEFVSTKKISYIMELNFIAGLNPYVKFEDQSLSGYRHYLFGMTLGFNYKLGLNSPLDCPEF